MWVVVFPPANMPITIGVNLSSKACHDPMFVLAFTQKSVDQMLIVLIGF